MLTYNRLTTLLEEPLDNQNPLGLQRCSYICLVVHFNLQKLYIINLYISVTNNTYCSLWGQFLHKY